MDDARRASIEVVGSCLSPKPALPFARLHLVCAPRTAELKAHFRDGNERDRVMIFQVKARVVVKGCVKETDLQERRWSKDSTLARRDDASTMPWVVKYQVRKLQLQNSSVRRVLRFHLLHSDDYCPGRSAVIDTTQWIRVLICTVEITGIAIGPEHAQRSARDRRPLV
ncbi:hypothetical protein SCHPADRAFT_886151 [Schizopora paradoxa]|uniref:Uncharacterized protein n=1 Tax=Schizopora paradoxa TaxID=27342 RepID=A0A0H2S377_9AGAM|nr:hypothetical protein SCHPADRAFT_886151 [Schizopora paradoxa]